MATNIDEFGTLTAYSAKTILNSFIELYRLFHLLDTETVAGLHEILKSSFCTHTFELAIQSYGGYSKNTDPREAQQLFFILSTTHAGKQERGYISFQKLIFGQTDNWKVL